MIYPAVRYLLGTALLFFGANNLIRFLPAHAFPGEAGVLMSAFETSGYVLSTVGIVQILLAVALLTDHFVPLALLLFAPVLVNIVFFHLFLDPAGIGPALPVLALTVYLFAYHASAFIHLVKNQGYASVS